MRFTVLQSLVGVHPVTGIELSLRPGDITDWCPIEGPKMVDAGIFAPISANAPIETPETPQVKSKRSAKETR